MQELSPASVQLIELAKEEARRLAFDFIGTEHLLVALYRQDTTVTKSLNKKGINLNKLREVVEEKTGTGIGNLSDTIDYTPLAKKILLLALEVAQQNSRDSIEPEDIYQGLLEGKEGVGLRILRELVEGDA